MIKFEYHQNLDGKETKLTYESNAIVLDEILDNFRSFLIGCGYPIEGDLEEVTEWK